MKKYLTFGLLIMSALAAIAAPPTLVAPIGGKRAARKPAPPPPIYRENVGGGNPLQMLNPYAPAKYGTAAQSVVLDPDTGKWKGIKLFEFFF